MKRLIVTVALAAAFAAHASDGVIEINHAKIMANGGYPYAISQPGSYRLTSNLRQPDKDTDVLRISASAANASLDLNGFVVAGNNVCSWTAGIQNCTNPNGAGTGILVDGNDVRIFGGSVSGIGGRGIVATARGLALFDVTVAHCGDAGVEMTTTVPANSVARIDRVDVHDNYGSGILGRRGNAAVRFSTFADNGYPGVYMTVGTASVIGSVFINNYHGQIEGSGTASQNTYVGMLNGYSAVSVPPNSNLCNGSPC